MTAAQLVLPVCTCTPGKRCQQCAERGRAHLRMYRLCGLYKSGADPIAYADQVTSLNDARAALCLAMGVPIERIDPCTGHRL